jgi:DNA replication licensing factor MCM2
MENVEADYRPVPALDTYGKKGLDDTVYAPLSAEARARAEEAMRRRDRQRGGEGRRGALPTALQSSSMTSELGSDDPGPELARRLREREDRVSARKRRLEAGRAAEPGGGGGGGPGGPGDDGAAMDEDEDDDDFNLDAVHGTLREYIVSERPMREIARRFTQFLREFTRGGETSVYGERIENMVVSQKRSLEVSYVHLSQVAPTLAIWLADCPAEMLKIFDAVAYNETIATYPEYREIANEIKVRITDVPVGDSIRDIRQMHLNALIRVKGVITRRSGVYPQLKAVKFDCGKCGAVLGPFAQNGVKEARVGSCSECQSKGPFNVNQEQTLYQSYQRITLQESPGTVPPGRLPRQKEVILLGDLIDYARPGDEVEVTGIYTNNFDLALNRRNSFPVFATLIEANHVAKNSDEIASFRLTQDDVAEVHELSRDPKLASKIVASIAPSIYGHENIKMALALSMLGGVFKDVDQKHRLRGDINVLIMGDPGTAKSQFLKYVEKTSHRAVFTTGQGASAVGLTASVRIDPVTREWTLEGGALVLADRGVCLIDEFDKMNDADRTSIHEAMEQQSISIAKAGIVTTLQARCAVIAAANPIKGRYDASLSFADNVDLTEPILSRFDVMCVVRDVHDPIADERLANFVVGSHQASLSHQAAAAGATAGGANPVAAPPPISQALLRKYFVYARQRVTPKLGAIDQDKITSLYAQLRQESQNGAGVPVTVRLVESIIRLCEAHARMHLREYVNEDDVDAGIRVVLESFISAQKNAVQRSLTKSFAKYLSYRQDNDTLLLHILRTMVRETLRYERVKAVGLRAAAQGEGPLPAEVRIDTDEFETRARDYKISNVSSFYESEPFRQEGFRKEGDVIIRQFAGTEIIG